MVSVETGAPRCAQKRDDCFTNFKDNRCYILTDTRFKKKCPFYKKKEKEEGGGR